MQTSFFKNLSAIRNPLSISGRAPDFYKGPQYKVLAPKVGFFLEYKAGRLDEEGYTREFYRQVLAELNPRLVYDHLVNTYGEDVTLLCYEFPGEFCHRRLVAGWFMNNLGVEVPEFGFHEVDACEV